MLNITFLNDMLSVFMVNVVRLSVVAPLSFGPFSSEIFRRIFLFKIFTTYYTFLKFVTLNQLKLYPFPFVIHEQYGKEATGNRALDGSMHPG